MINKAFDEINARDIELLVENSRQERRTLEYKEKLPGQSDEDKREFLSDVVSFASAAGGDIIYGIADQRDSGGQPTGIPERIVGLGDANVDAEIRRLDNLCRDCVEPRIAGLRLTGIAGLTEGPAIVMRIPKGWLGPHMMSYKGSTRFYSRNSAGKYRLDFSELRAAFASAEALPERVRRFRYDRLAKIMGDDVPYPLSGPKRIVLHFSHVRAFDLSSQIEFIDVSHEKLPPMYSAGYNFRINFDGLLTFSPDGAGQCHSYTQLFRSGAIEAVESRLLDPTGGENIPTSTYESELISSLAAYFRLARELQLDTPWFVMVTIIGVKGYTLGIRRVYRTDLVPIDRDMLLFPEIVVEDENAAAETVLRPAFDSFWQAGGLTGSRNYDENGNWVGQR